MGKNACWHWKEGLIQIPAPTQKLGMVIYAPVTLAPRGEEKELLGLADHRLAPGSVRPCLKGLRQREVEQDSRPDIQTCIPMYKYTIHIQHTCTTLVQIHTQVYSLMTSGTQT